MKTCPDCGCRVYKLGCVNCDEAAYIDEQRNLTALMGEPPSADAVDPGADSGTLSTREKTSSSAFEREGI